MLRKLRHELKATLWKARGSIPGAAGASAAKWIAIDRAIAEGGGGPWGHDDPGIDERVVEYPWVFHRLAALDAPGGRVLDAGSILNHARILEHWRAARRSPVSIVTLAHEGAALVSDHARYEFADLRELPYRDEWFSAVLCISTLEHVGLDTAIYGARARRSDDANAEASRALRELARVTRKGGTLLLSVPYGARSNRGWLRVLDADDLALVQRDTGWSPVTTRYFRATASGWRECGAEDAKSAGYNEPSGRPGERTAPPHVAAAEAVALLELRRT